ncbi:MAG: mechanosensitive ion channel [Gammaproteobacteria bacterium]|nr:mechanosensitive ion channel [Gammaproteobacteria bacterium]MDX2488221.1 mechanosensitive ion channel [Gammaproteobacteria bacterium]
MTTETNASPLFIKSGQWLLLLLLTFLFSAAFADNIAQSSGNRQSSPHSVDTAPVIVNGAVVFDVPGIRAYPARRRAGEIADTVKAIAADASKDPAMITAVDKPDVKRTEISLGDQYILSVFDFDGEVQGIDNRQITAEVFAIKIREVIQSYRHDRSSSRIKKNIMLALARTAALFVILVVFLWIFRRLDKLIERSFKRRVKKIEAKSMRLVQSEQLWRVLRTLLSIIKTLLILIVIYFFLTLVLNLFPWTRYISGRLLELVLNPLKTMGMSILDYLPSLFFLVILLLFTRYILKLTYNFFDAVNRQSLRLQRFEADWAWPTYRIARIVIIIFAVVIAYPYIPGSSSEAFKGISLFLGVLLSLGSTSVISNVIAGYTMTYRRAFKLGDKVKIGETIGEVTEIRLLVTNLRSLKNEKIVMPNSTILNSEVINYSALAREQGLILHTTVGIGYEVPWRQVEAILLEAADRTDGLLKKPAPFVLQKALTDFSVTYEINVYCDDDNGIASKYSALHRNIQDVFNENNVQIMTPNYIADTPEPKVVPPDSWYAAPATKPEPEKAPDNN